MRTIIVLIFCLSLPCFGITQPICPAATNLRASEIGNTKATLAWETAPEDQHLNVQIEFKVNQVNGGPYQSASSVHSGNTFLLTGLQPGTRYVFRVSILKSNCWTNWAYSPEFTTTICDNPIQLNASITGSAATLSWINPGSATSIAEYKASSSSTWNIITNVSSAPNGSGYVSGLAPGTIYDWRVKNVCNNNGIITTTAYSTSQFQTSCTLSPPGGISCSSTSSSITLSWASVSGATSYSLEYKPASSSNWISYGNFSTNTATISGLAAVTTYNWRVKTNCSSGSSAFAESTCATTAPCNIPAGLACTSSSPSAISVSWNPVAGATNYSVEYKPASSSNWISYGNFSTNTATISGLAAVTTYNWRVKTNCSSGSSAFAESTCATTAPCNIPAGLACTSSSPSAISISWNAVAGATNYSVEYKPASSSNWISDGNFSTNTATISGLAAVTTYNWRVKTNCSSGSSAFAESTCATTAPCNIPAGLACTSSSPSAISISWNPVTGATSYTVEYKPASSSIWISYGNFSTNTATISGLAAGTTYNWKVKSNCLSGSSAYSQNSCNTLADCGPLGFLSPYNITTVSATVRWFANSQALSYIVEYKPFGSSTWISLPSTVLTSQVISGLTPNTIYDYRMKADCSNYITSQFATLPAASCGEPQNLTVSSITGSTATISWNAVPGATGYNLYYSAYGFLPVTTTTTSTSTELVNLTPGTTYTVTVSAACGTNSGMEVNYPFTTLTSSACTPPVLQTPEVANWINSILSWNVVSGASGYTLAYRNVIDPYWNTINTTAASVSLNLLPSTAYYWQVKTNCGTASSTYTQGSFTTQGPSAPANLATTNITTTGATLSWSPVSGALSYSVERTDPAVYGTWYPVSTVTATSVNLTGLSAGNNYNWRVKTNVTGGSSAWATANFNTLTGPGGGSSSRNAVNLQDGSSPELTAAGKHSIYPNPAHDHINVQLPAAAANCLIRVYDQNGKTVLTKFVTSRAVQLNIAALAKGLYTVTISNANGEVLSRSKFVNQ